MFAVVYLKNPFSSPWPQKLKLEPPARLTDPKYGAHQYVIANVSVLFILFLEPLLLVILFKYFTASEFRNIVSNSKKVIPARSLFKYVEWMDLDYINEQRVYLQNIWKKMVYVNVVLLY